MASKQFKIGEYAIGGVINVTASGGRAYFEARDWDDNELIRSFDTNDRLEALTELNDWTSSYYADQIIEFVEKHMRWTVNEWRSL